MTFELSSSGRSVAYSDPLRRPWPRGTDTVPGGTAGVGYANARMEPWEDSTRTTSPSLTFSRLASSSLISTQVCQAMVVNGSEYATDRPEDESSNVMDILEAGQVDETGALAWANTRVTVTPTGEKVKIARFEGIVRAVEVGNTPGERIIHTVTTE